jgi:hypothetical protein
MKIDLIEKTGIYVDGKEILFGSDIEVAKKVLGSCHGYESNYSFLDGVLAFCVDDNKRIMEIEVRNVQDDKIVVMFRTLEIFKEEKENLLRHMSAFNEAPLLNNDGDGCGYYAQNLGVEFSFGMSEEDIEDLIRESKEDGVYEEMKEEIEGDIYRSKYIDAFLIRQ